MSTTKTTISNTTTKSKSKRKMPSTTALQPHQRSKSYHTAHGKFNVAILTSFHNILYQYYTNDIYYFIHIAIDFWKHFSERPLDTIFHPKSVALIGASEKPGSVGRTILWNLLSSPFGGTIYPVNNRLKSKNGSNNIFGIKSYQHVKDIPEDDGIDLVIIAVPSRAVKEVCVFISVVCGICSV